MSSKKGVEKATQHTAETEKCSFLNFVNELL